LDLRRCNYNVLTVYESMEEYICHGDKESYTALIQSFLDDRASIKMTALIQQFPSKFRVAPALKGISIYSNINLSRYSSELKSQPLSSMINIHLHEHFLEMHPTFAIVHPLEPQLIIFRSQSEALARCVAQCPTGPFAGTCPPSFPDCKPCKPATIANYDSLEKVPKHSYVFATLPHPFSVTVQKKNSLSADPRVLRETKRDDWIESVSEGLTERHAGAYQRTQRLKDVISSPVHGVWQIWEDFNPSSLSWTLGFQLEESKWSVLGDKGKNIENELLTAARQQVLSHSPDRDRDALELWNLAWTELWYFVRVSRIRAGTSG
jgi:hypothetical protein